MSAPEMTSPLDAARAFRDRGWRPIPLRWRDKRPVSSEDGWSTQAASEPTDATLELWFGRGRVNVGIACKPSGLLVVDSDVPGALEQFAAERGETLPLTYRVRTRKDWHWYFDASEYPELGNSPGELGEYGMDVRGGGSTQGGYVVAAGSVHETGHVYLAEEPATVPAMLPGWLAEAIATPIDGPAGTGATRPIGGWSDDVRHGTAVDLHAQYSRHVNAVQHRGGLFRYELFLAALDGWRLVDLGLLTEGQMADDLRAAVHRVWGADPDERDRRIVNVEARERADASPWRLSQQGGVKLGPDGPPAGDDTDPTGGEVAETEKVDARELLVLDAMRQIDVRTEARRRIDARDRPALSMLDLDAFLDAPQPEYLVPRLLYRNGTAKCFGPPGGTKSFFLLDLALSLATGTTWHGHELAPATVHYVMAEGQATNTARALAWFHARGVDRAAARDEATGRSRFRAIPQGVLLTPEGITGYLEAVRDERPALVILDTKNRMMVGEENSASDVAVMIRSMDAIREAADGACVLLVDHTGLTDTSRGRGSNAVEAAMDTEVRCQRDEGGIAVAEVTRDKAAEPGASWLYRIERVEGVTGLRPGTPTPAVPVPVDASVVGPSRDLRVRWHDFDQPAVPAALAECGEKGADAGRDIYRVLQFVDDPDGITRGAIDAALAEGPRRHGKSTVTAGLALLVRMGFADKPTRGSYALGQRS